jgi:FMN phosphatase YigB (HAD superfamily)
MNRAMNPEKINCIIFDFADTLCSDLYFQTNPPNCRNWREIFEKHIFEKHWLTEWCNGRVGLLQVASIIQKYVKMSRDEIIIEMKEGCRNLSFNQAIYNYALSQLKAQKKTALVTANMDIFSEIIVPHYKLDSVFNIIVNSADYHTDNKLELWNIAFQLLGTNVNYESSLLIDDSEKWVNAFIHAGGNAYKYTDDIAFLDWLSESKIE